MTFVVTEACIRCKYTDCVAMFTGQTRPARRKSLGGSDTQAWRGRPVS